MKKLFGMIAALAMSVTCLTACGSSEDAFVGKWECKEMNMEGMTISDEFMGIPVAVMAQMELKDDKTGTVSSVGEEAESFEWEVKDDDTIIATLDGEEVEFKKDGDLITMEIDGAKTVLTKVDKFTEFDASALEDLGDVPDIE